MNDVKSTILALAVTVILIRILATNAGNTLIEWAWTAVVSVVLFSMLVWTRRGRLSRRQWRKLGGALFLAGVLGGTANPVHRPGVARGLASGTLSVRRSGPGRERRLCTLWALAVYVRAATCYNRAAHCRAANTSPHRVSSSYKKFCRPSMGLFSLRQARRWRLVLPTPVGYVGVEGLLLGPLRHRSTRRAS